MIHRPARSATLLLLACAALVASSAAPALASQLTISAVANGSATPTPVPPTQGLQNGDFFMQPNPGGVVNGDGIDDPTQWVFDFTTDPDFAIFPTNVPLSSALLTLSLTIGNEGITTDLVGMTDPAFTSFLPPGPVATPILQSLAFPGTYTVQIELLNFYASADVLGSLTSNGGMIPMLYHDDVILFHARLDLVTSGAPLDHFKCYTARPVTRTMPFRVTLTDQFESQEVTVIRPIMLCNPVEKCDAAGVCTSIENPEAHLTCYRTLDVAGTPEFVPQEVLVTNQFGRSQRLEILRRRNLLCLPSQKTEVGPLN